MSIVGKSFFSESLSKFNIKTNEPLFVIISNTFTDIVCSDTLQTRHNDYNYLNAPAVKKYLENFPYKKMISTQNSLKIDLKATAEPDEFYYQLRDTFIDGYNCDIQCVGPCYSCGTNMENFV